MRFFFAMSNSTCSLRSCCPTALTQGALRYCSLTAEQGSKLRLYGVARSIALCEADNEVRRIKEELELLPQEMRAHLRYLQQLLATQSNIEAALLAAEQVPAAQLEAAAGGVVAAGYVQLGGTGRYQASAVQLLESSRAVSGALSYVLCAQQV
jgi:hypothetical protein